MPIQVRQYVRAVLYVCRQTVYPTDWERGNIPFRIILESRTVLHYFPAVEFHTIKLF